MNKKFLTCSIVVNKVFLSYLTLYKILKRIFICLKDNENNKCKDSREKIKCQLIFLRCFIIFYFSSTLFNLFFFLPLYICLSLSLQSLNIHNKMICGLLQLDLMPLPHPINNSHFVGFILQAINNYRLIIKIHKYK